MVGNIFFVDSRLDRSAHLASSDVHTSHAVFFACAHCGARFPTSRAMESHMRAKHGQRLAIKQFIGSSKCPSCGTDFQSRLRCIAHLSDRRRTVCSEWVQKNCRPIGSSRLDKLDEVDRAARRKAQQQGLSHATASMPAKAATGRIVGRVS